MNREIIEEFLMYDERGLPVTRNVSREQAERSEFEVRVRRECEQLADMLIAKNRAYGNSAFEPVRIFSRADVTEQIKVRIDDKLSRLARGSDAGEDVTLDLLGYIVLLRVARSSDGAQ